MYETGRIVTWQGFSSASTTARVAADFLGSGGADSTLFVLHSRAARDIKQQSAIQAEDEVLFCMDSQFRVHGTMQTGYKQLLAQAMGIDMQVLRSPYSLPLDGCPLPPTPFPLLPHDSSVSVLASDHESSSHCTKSPQRSKPTLWAMVYEVQPFDRCNRLLPCWGVGRARIAPGHAIMHFVTLSVLPDTKFESNQVAASNLATAPTSPLHCYNGERPDPRTPVWPYRSNREDLIKTVVPQRLLYTHTFMPLPSNPHNNTQILDHIHVIDGMPSFFPLPYRLVICTKKVSDQTSEVMLRECPPKREYMSLTPALDGTDSLRPDLVWRTVRMWRACTLPWVPRHTRGHSGVEADRFARCVMRSHKGRQG